MLRGGYAEEYTYDTAYERQSTYRSVEQQARSTGHGLWSGCSQQPEPEPVPAATPTSEPTTEPPAPEPIAPAPAPAAPAPASGPAAQGWTNDSLTPGYTGCRQGYPGGRVSGVYWWKPIAC